MDMPVTFDVIAENYIADVNPRTVNVGHMPSHNTVTKYVNGKQMEFDVAKDGIFITEKDEIDIPALSEMIQNATGEDVRDMLSNMISEMGTAAYRNAFHDVFANYRLALVQKNNMSSDEFNNAKSSADMAMYALGTRGYSKNKIKESVETLQVSFGQGSEYAREQLKIAHIKNADPDFFNNLKDQLERENPKVLKNLKTFLKVSDEMKKVSIPYVSEAFDMMVFENSHNLNETEQLMKQLKQQQKLIETVASKALKKEKLPVELENISNLSDKTTAYEIMKGLIIFDTNVGTVTRRLKDVSTQINSDLERAASTSYEVPLMQQQVKINGFINSMLDGNMAKGRMTGTSISEAMVENVPEYMKNNTTLVSVGGARLTFEQVRSPKYKLEANVSSAFGEDGEIFKLALKEGLRYLPAKFDESSNTIKAEGNRIEIGKIKDLTSKLEGYVKDVKVTTVHRVNESELKAHYNKYRGSIKKQIMHEITHHPSTEFDVLYTVEQMVAFENTADDARYDEGRETCFMEFGKELVKELEKEKKVMKVTTRDGTEILAKAVKKIVIENDTGRSNRLGQNGRL